MVEAAFIFPGQGAQYVGMGKTLYDQHEVARKTFGHANELLGFDLAKLCFEGPKEELVKTENCQVAILVASVAALRVLLSQGSSEFTPEVTLGLSLGEYTALVAAEALSFSDAVKIVRLRGRYMEEAGRDTHGTMASILGLEEEAVTAGCEDTGAEIANLNCPGQVVVSGTMESIERMGDFAKARGARRVKMLDVSGAFHSTLMASASHKLKDALGDVQILEPKIPVISNVTAHSERDPSQIKENLIDQVSTTTHWEESIRNVIKGGITTFVEIGPGSVLKGLLRRIDPSLICHNISA